MVARWGVGFSETFGTAVPSNAGETIGRLIDEIMQMVAARGLTKSP